MINASAINVGIDASGAKKGASEVTASLKSIEASLRTLQKVLTDVNKTAAAGGGGGAAAGGQVAAVTKSVPEATKTLEAFMGTLNKIRNTLFVVYLLREAFDGLTASLQVLIQTGFAFNAAMEQAVIGSGALIAQIGQLERKGIKLEGVEAIREGMKLAKEEVIQLQIAGLQTAATSTALVAAFQQAVGPGLAAGLALKQVRDLTVDIVQVSTAIGQPMHQIAQEVRAIFEGTVDPNARVGKLLAIDNKVIKDLQGTAKLYDYIADKLDKFRAIGPVIEKSWSGVTSNLQEFGEVLAGLVTQPLFEKLTASLVKFNEELRKGGAGKNAEELKDLFAPDLQIGVENLQLAFAELGAQADRVLFALLDRARDMLEVFGQDPQEIRTLEEAIRRLGDSIVKLINEADVQAWLRDTIDGFNDLSKAFKEVDEFAGYVNRALKWIEEGLQILLSPLGLVIRGLTLLLSLRTTFGDWGDLYVKTSKEVNHSIDEMGKAWNGAVENANKMETASERMAKALSSVSGQAGILEESTDSAGKSVKKLAELGGKALPAIGSTPKGATADEKLRYLQGKMTAKEIEERVTLRGPPKGPPKDDKKGADKAKREAERAAAIERAFQLAKLQLIEQTARDEVQILDKYNKIALDQLDEKRAAQLINQKDYIEQRLRIEVKGAEDEEKLAALRVQNTIEAGKKALAGLLPADVQTLLTTGVEGLDQLQKALTAAIPLVQTQDQAEALRETTQAVNGLANARFNLAKVSGAFLVRALPVGPLPEAVDIAEEPDSVRRRLIAGAGAKARARETALLKDELAIQTALTHGQITQAEASERLADAAERRSKFEVAILEAERAGLDPATQQLEIHQKTLQIMEKEAQVFRVSNADAFFKGLNENIDKLSDKFQQLGEDIRGIFKDAFEELGRTGFRGFIDTFLSGIADALNTRAADALSQIVTKILTDIFKPGGGGQSIFDKLIEQLMSIFGRKPTGSFSIGGVLEKIFGKLLDPLGRKKQGDLPIQGAPKGLPEILEDVRRASTPEAQTLSTLATLNTEVGGIHRDTMDIAQSLRELKQCCAEHNSLLKQQMANAAKGPSLLGAILSAAVGAAAGQAVGGLFQGAGRLTSYPGSGEDLPFPDMPNIPPGLPPIPPHPGIPGGTFPQPPAPVTTNITIVTPNPAAFNAPQTQAQIGSLVFNNIQKAQTLVPAITNPKP